MTLPRVQRVILLVSLVQLLLALGVTYVAAQSQETTNALTMQRFATVETRIAALELARERERVVTRLELLEQSTLERRWLERSVAAAVIGILATNLLGLIKRK